MTDWTKWTERRPTNADAQDGLIEFAWHARHRSYHTWDCAFQTHDPPRYWRTPTPLPGEEPGPAVASVNAETAYHLGPDSAPPLPATAGSDAELSPVVRATAELAAADAYWLRHYVGQALVGLESATRPHKDYARWAVEIAAAALAAVKAQEDGK